MRASTVTSVVCAVAGGVAWAGVLPPAEFQFQINAVNVAPGYTLTPPSIGLVYGGSGVGGNVTNAMAFAWNSVVPTPAEALLCDDECGVDAPFVNDFFAGGATLPVGVLLRRYDDAGVALDAADVVVASNTLFVNGPMQTPALALRPVNSGVGRTNAFKLEWWDMWDWFGTGGPCGAPACGNQPVGWWERGWANFTDAAPSFGASGTLAPAVCRGQRPSPAWGPTARISAWRDVTGACRQILVGINGDYGPAAPPVVVVRAAEAGFDVDRPCAAWSASGSFVVAWREDDRSADQSAIRARRVFANGTVGQIIEVTGFGNAWPGSGPAVSMFDDGSFAVQWLTFENGDPPTSTLVAQRYNNLEPAGIVGGTYFIDGPMFGSANHTITARGASADVEVEGLNGLSSVYEFGAPGVPDNVYGRRLMRDSTGAIGERTLIPLHSPVETGNTLGEAHQHTALLRSDGRVAVAWRRELDGNVYATVRELPAPAISCGPADVAGPGQTIGFDGQLTADDIIVFINWFFANDSRADVAGPGQIVGGDGEWTADDIIVFIGWFFAGC
jgi:hypothetical protein